VSSLEQSKCKVLEYLICANLIGHRSFTGHAERMRAKGKLLPDKFYRTGYEGSGTLSQFVTPDCLTKHRDVPHLKLHDENAFQNVGDFVLSRDLTRIRVERQFKTQMKREPSSLISMFDNLGEWILSSAWNNAKSQ
jgi:hypothetical protein